ncbi:hypothetical protein HZA55_00910 [Candidatus Poribacteria bacterium]|nr:hypothetical protein [Candidatus Poribacteria bacterium]
MPLSGLLTAIFSLMELLYKQGLIFITDVKKSMKRLMSKTDVNVLDNIDLQFDYSKYS